MTSKKSRATAGANQGNKALTNDSSLTAQPEDGLLFPIAPETPDILSNSKPERGEPLSANKPEPEELLLPSHDEAKALCNLAAQIKALAPWQWMQETDVFGVEDPDTGEIGFVSVMGQSTGRKPRVPGGAAPLESVGRRGSDLSFTPRL